MIPQKLTIEGLYSYQERQTIDFSDLTEAGLFGIFGAVGSGKSSILEAVSFALYGETERLNSRDKRAYNMMNLKSNRSYIEFDFLNHENKLFRATREFRRNSKNFEDVKPASVIFYEFKNNTWESLEHVNAEELIGLNYTNFKRTIIIPQGQFKEFLELGAKERTDMMKEIFQLHRFDLQDKVSTLLKNNKSELDQIEGKLSGFEMVSQEAIEALKNQHQEQNEKSNEIQKEFAIINEIVQQLKALKSDFESLNQKKKEVQILNDKKQEIDVKREQIEVYERIFSVFHQVLQDQKRIQSELKSKSSEKEIQQQNVKELQEKVNEVSQKIGALKPDFEQLSAKRIEENDLSFLVQIKEFETEIEKLKIRTQKGSDELKQVQEKEKISVEFIKEKEDELSNLSAKRIDSQLLLVVGNWFNQNENLHQNLINQLQKNIEIETQLSEISDELKSLNVDEKSFEEDFKLKSESLISKKKDLENQKSQFEVQQQLSHYAHQLHEGEACPLCGALEHPSIIELDDVSLHLQKVLNEISDCENEQNFLQNHVNKVERLIFKKQNFEDQLKTENIRIDELKRQISEHQKQFVWTEFDAEKQEEFSKRKSESGELESQINSINELIKQKRSEIEEEQRLVEKYSKALQQFELEEVRKSTQIQQNKDHLKYLRFIDFENETSENLIIILENLKAKNNKTEHDFTQFNKEMSELNPKLASQKTALELQEKRIEELQKEDENINAQISSKLVEQRLNSVEQVEGILKFQLDVPNQRKQIEEFIIAFETLKNSISELELKLKDFSFDQNQFSETENQFKIKETELLEATKLLTRTSSEIERLEVEFKKKENVLKEQTELLKRAENLKTMFNLFKGAGFVQFVSSIYLRQLCDHANVRFHRMTRNQLSLQLNDNNDFEIIDYLNEGRSRSVKTLSGGQAFQVSLSLALALAESVQSNAKSEKNFFFIDEGFGTQDMESVNIVFETLMNLQRENRIVGIISHVEELKERIPISLTIEKDEEKGSKILIN